MAFASSSPNVSRDSCDIDGRVERMLGSGNADPTGKHKSSSIGRVPGLDVFVSEDICVDDLALLLSDESTVVDGGLGSFWDSPGIFLILEPM